MASFGSCSVRCAASTRESRALAAAPRRRAASGPAVAVAAAADAGGARLALYRGAQSAAVDARLAQHRALHVIIAPACEGVACHKDVGPSNVTASMAKAYGPAHVWPTGEGFQPRVRIHDGKSNYPVQVVFEVVSLRSDSRLRLRQCLSLFGLASESRSNPDRSYGSGMRTSAGGRSASSPPTSPGSQRRSSGTHTTSRPGRPRRRAGTPAAGRRSAQQKPSAVSQNLPRPGRHDGFLQMHVSQGRGGFCPI